jgi:hypothetical protein
MFSPFLATMLPSLYPRLTAFRGFRTIRPIQDLPEFLVTGKGLLPLFPGLFHDSHEPAGVIPGKAIHSNDIGLGDYFRVQNKPSGDKENSACDLFTFYNEKRYRYVTDSKKSRALERMNKGGDEFKVGVPVLRSPVFQKLTGCGKTLKFS